MRLMAAVLTIVGAGAPGLAQDIVIDFEELACTGVGWNPAGAEYKTQGFTFSNGRFLCFCSGDIYYAGSATLFNDLVGGKTTLTRDSGGAFDLSSIDLAPVFGTVPTEVGFEGYRDGVLVAEQTFVTSGVGRVLERFEFSSDFDVVDQVVISEMPFPHYQCDNVTIAGDLCYADCDGSGTLDLFDFLCFQNAFGAGDPAADCDGSGVLDRFDFLCFQNLFAAGCP